MIEQILFSKAMGLMEKGLDAASVRHSVIANNLANVDTPGYKRSEVVFEEELRKAIAGHNRITGLITNAKHILIGGGVSLEELTPKVTIRRETSMRNDGNNVDIDREMAALAKNTLLYSALAQGLNGELQKIRSAIFEGRR